MIYFPIPILKTFTIFGAVTTLVIALLMLGFTVYSYTNKNNPIKQLSALQNGLLLPLICSEIGIIIGTILGLYGIKKNVSCLITLFTIIVSIFCIIFLALGILSFILPQFTFGKQCEVSKIPLLTNATQAFNLGDNLCSNLCQCGLTNFNQYSQQQIQKLKTEYNLGGKVVKLQQCASLNINPTLKKIMNPLGQIQMYFKCTGWCEKTPVQQSLLFYKFSDVNNSPRPQGFCFEQIRLFLDTYSFIALIVCLSISTFLLLVCICNTCLCRHPSRKQHSSYKKMEQQ